MKIVKVQRAGASAAGVLFDDRITVIGNWHPGEADQSPFELPELTLDALRAAYTTATEVVALTEVDLAVPIDPRRKIICVGMNYRDHTAEISAEVAENPVLFTRSLDSLVSQGRPVVRPKASERFDFEGEIAIVIGKAGRHISREAALDHVFGSTCFMDGSVRDYQRHSLTAGKNFWRSGAMGPWIITRDEIGDADLALRTTLNGGQVQAAHASDMIFGIAEVIEYCSRWTMLVPGDVIATGTPGGVGARRTPPLWMKPGDRINVEISGVGLLSNPVVAE